ncbi:DNA topoisomerase I [Candidatus Pacearchaeota archaeon]|nr:DNA topoisomerase I [Candidatus Pacearchaeota archaeon]
MQKKIEKTKEEKLAESFFPVDESDTKYGIEKEQKKPLSFTGFEEAPIKETQRKQRSGRKKFSRKLKRTRPQEIIKKEKEVKIPKISLKKEGYELIITEKPQAALKIASVLGKYEKRNYQKVPYYEVNRNGKRIFVACAVGHLFSLTQNAKSRGIPTFDISWVPNFTVRKNDFTERYYNTILKLVKNAGEITIATDYDIEGEVIGYNIMRFICSQKDANRMKFSTLTEKELNDSYEKKSSSIDWGQAIAGETRHYLDWLYGINLSRALMNAIKSTGSFRIMSIGRVQGPSLKLIVEKEKQIQSFKSEPYWQVFIKVKNKKTQEIIELKHTKDISKKTELKKFDNLKDKEIDVTTEKKSQILPPGVPFNLTLLQIEAYKLYGMTPSKTLQIAQSLYLSGLISYPRTSSQKLPASINYEEILNNLAKKYKVEKLITKNKPVEGNKTDPAHPSIYPTGNFQIVSGDDEKIYNLIVKRFLSLFCDDAIIENKKIRTEINSLHFSLSGSAIRKKGWMEIYPAKLQEKEIPDFNEKGEILDVKIEEKQTQPPKRYSPASIIAELEKRNLGTKATRSMILETLYNRNYIKEKSIEATPLGISLIDTLNKYSPIIIDEKLTKNFEKEMNLIQTLKKRFQEKEKEIISKAEESITKIISQFKKNEKDIGKELLDANIKLNEERKIENTLNICPICKKGNLIISYSKKNKKHFVACNAYPECKNTYSLPQGFIKKAEKNCEDCNFPMLMRIARGKRPWIFCFNVSCPSNKKRIEEYRKKHERNINENL